MMSTTSPLQIRKILEDSIPMDALNIIEQIFNDVKIKQKQEQSLEDRVESLENELIKLKTEREIVDTMSYNEGDIIYGLFSKELELEHMGEIVAIDIDERKPVGYGKNISEAFLQAKIVNPNQEQFYFRKVGKSYLEKI